MKTNFSLLLYQNIFFTRNIINLYFPLTFVYLHFYRIFHQKLFQISNVESYFLHSIIYSQCLLLPNCFQSKFHGAFVTLQHER